MTEVLRCGRVVSAVGVRHDPARITALRQMPSPSTGQELQQFICALNWMRLSLPAFNKMVSPLTVFMEKIYASAGSRKKSQVRRVVLQDAEWSDVEATALQQCKDALANALTLAHPDPVKCLCVFMDASDEHWGRPSPKSLSLPPSPQLDDTFVWPTLDHVRSAQALTAAPDTTVVVEDSIVRDAQGKIWLPDAANALHLRICLVGHFGAAGHRTMKATLQAIADKFTWTDLTADVTRFVGRCLHCASVTGGPPMPRPLGEALHAEKPNELIHWDFLTMGPATTGDAYVLVIKDDASHYVWLTPTRAATADLTFESLME
ncbi:hypothetical protein F443_00604 [Phytophthora nicotianae P1569]|uniref:Integrase catalytic domain-containing protein n=1 Tax=Phytophthora nicotianae P1569 TaxID=1317065 RepID=V9FZY7_PHYNI|nr:hypothetical protein F443_00604 [Phytophthora nicotianae P1569]